MKRTGTSLVLLSLLAAVMVCASCGSRGTSTNQNSATSAKAEDTQGPSFELLNTWHPKKVLLEGYATAGEPATKFTITPAKGSVFLAVELMLQHDDPKKPVPGSLWSGIRLTDSAGKDHKFIFCYPATRAKYSPGGDSVEYAGDESDKTGDTAKSLSEMGKKLVVVFESPADETEFKIEIENGKPIPVSLKTK